MIASRFSSGSARPRRAAKNSSAASTIPTSTPSFRKSAATRSGSPSRMMPFCTKIVRSLEPRARWPSIVTTDESTPPERALMAAPSPTAALTAATCSSMNRAGSSSLTAISRIMRGPPCGVVCRERRADEGNGPAGGNRLPRGVIVADVGGRVNLNRPRQWPAPIARANGRANRPRCARAAAARPGSSPRSGCPVRRP